MNVAAQSAAYRIDEIMQVAEEFRARTGKRPAMIVWDAEGKPVPLATRGDVIAWKVRQRTGAGR